MKVIIAGSRKILDKDIVEQAMLEAGFEITEVICGMAQGVDMLGAQIASELGIPVKNFPADWDTHGRAAGAIRNKQMGDYAQCHNGGLIAVWDGKSRGTAHMIDYANKKGLQVFVKVLL